ncbi:MAG: hypothetical protein ACTSQK_11920 [Candidatus Heimdallarchaeota archaeon]
MIKTKELYAQTMEHLLYDYNIIEYKIQQEMLNYELLDHMVTQISKLCRVTESEMFSKTRQTHVVEARFLFYGLCKTKGLGPVDILRYMKTRGYSVTHGTVLYGQKKANGQLFESLKIAKAWMENPSIETHK